MQSQNTQYLQCVSNGDIAVLHYTIELCNIMLTHKHRETHGCVVTTVATDALVLKHQAISILSTD